MLFIQCLSYSTNVLTYQYVHGTVITVQYKYTVNISQFTLASLVRQSIHTPTVAHSMNYALGIVPSDTDTRHLMDNNIISFFSYLLVIFIA